MGQLTSVGASDLAEFYLGGRADGTLVVYDGVLKKVWEHGKKLQVPVFLWGEGEVVSLLVQMGRDGTSENAVKQAMACVNCQTPDQTKRKIRSNQNSGEAL